MEARRPTATRNIFQRALTLSKPPAESLLTSNLTIPFLNKNLLLPKRVNSDAAATATNLSSRSTHSLFGPKNKFDFSRAQKLLETELDRRCAKVPKTARYDPKTAAELARDLSQQLRRALKPDLVNSIRYKIVVITTILQAVPNRQTHQFVTIASRCLWSQDTDGSITIQAKLGYDMYATATLFAVYTE